MKIKLMIALLVLGSLASSAQLQNPVKWSYAAKRINKTEVVLYMKATMDQGWHIYSINQKAGGPEATVFKFVPSKTYSLIGKMAEPKPVVKYEDVFKMDVLYFEQPAVFTQKIKVSASNKPYTVKGAVTYMACTDKQCLPPAEVEFSIPVK